MFFRGQNSQVFLSCITLAFTQRISHCENRLARTLKSISTSMRQRKLQNITTSGGHLESSCYFDVDLDTAASSSAASASSSLSVSQFLTLCRISSRLMPPSRTSAKLCEVIPLR